MGVNLWDIMGVNPWYIIACKLTGPEEYRDPRRFFERTHLTRTLQSLIRDVLNTLRGQPGANSVIHLQTNFGGGKTHAELALYHLLTAPEAALATPRVAGFLVGAGLVSAQGDHEGRPDIPKAAVAALPCADLDAGGRVLGDPTGSPLQLNTLWGELAYRLGGRDLFALIRESDARRTAPGVVKLRELLEAAGPNVILIDEFLHYIEKAAAVKVTDSNLATQTLAFARELTEAVDTVPHSILVASLTMSKMEDLQVLSTEDAHLTLARLEDIFRRVEDARTPIESAEIYDIVRARLFEQVDEAAAAETAAAYAQFYRSEPWRDLLPPATREGGYEALLRQAYPFHPSIIQVLYERWGSRPQFQLTRGTLRFLAHLLAHLYRQDLSGFPKPDRSETLIQLADVDLADDDVRAEAIRVAGSAWEAVIGADIAAADSGAAADAGALAIAQRLDRERGGLYARYGLHEGLATSVFIASHGGEQRKPTPQAEIRLAVARPALPLSDLNQALDDCRARLYYYYDEEGGLLFKTEPNPNKVLADERANVTTDQARAQVERVVAEVLGPARLFNVTTYGFQQAPGDVPDDDALQLVILPPRLTLTRGKASGRTADVLHAIAEQYAQRLRMNRNRVLFMAPEGAPVASAIDKAMDWLAARNVAGDADLMARFSATQQDVVRDRVTDGENSTKDHVRKAYNTVLLPTAPPADGPQRPAWEVVELGYIPPSKPVIAQAEEELLKAYKIHQQFNPALLEDRWAALWPKTATVITTQALWEKFARRVEAPILAGLPVLQAMIRTGVEQGVFGYGVLVDDTRDKLQAASYERERVYFGPFDAAEMGAVELGPRGVLLRPGQVDALFPPITPDEVAMLLHKARQSVDEVFHTARRLPTVKGRVDATTFFAAVSAGVRAGLFGYAASADGAVQRGAGAALTPEEVAFTGWLIGEDTPLPLTVEELARLLPASGRLAVEELYAQAMQTYGAERVTEQGVLDLLRRILREGRCGYAETLDAPVRPGVAAVALAGYVGQPELPPPDTRIIRLRGVITPMEMANVMKTAMNLSRLSAESSITLALDLELKGEVNDHSVQMALKEIQGRVKGVEVEDVRGE